MFASVERTPAHAHGAEAPVGSGISGGGQSSLGSLGTPGGRGPV